MASRGRIAGGRRDCWPDSGGVLGSGLPFLPVLGVSVSRETIFVGAGKWSWVSDFGASEMCALWNTSRCAVVSGFRKWVDKFETVCYNTLKTI